MKLALASILTLAVAARVTLLAQIPERAQWEITFAQVEAAAYLPDPPNAGSETYEARVMQRPWSAAAPMPFLRVVRTDGAMRACETGPFYADCEHVWIKTKADDTYREESCNMPKPETPAAAILRLIKKAADASWRR